MMDASTTLVIIALAAGFLITWRSGYVTILSMLVVGALVALIGHGAVLDAAHARPWLRLPVERALEVRALGIAFAFGALISLLIVKRRK